MNSLPGFSLDSWATLFSFVSVILLGFVSPIYVSLPRLELPGVLPSAVVTRFIGTTTPLTSSFPFRPPRVVRLVGGYSILGGL